MTNYEMDRRIAGKAYPRRISQMDECSYETGRCHEKKHFTMGPESQFEIADSTMFPQAAKKYEHLKKNRFHVDKKEYSHILQQGIPSFIDKDDRSIRPDSHARDIADSAIGSTTYSKSSMSPFSKVTFSLKERSDYSKMHQKNSKNRCTPEKLPYFMDEKREGGHLKDVSDYSKIHQKKSKNRCTPEKIPYFMDEKRVEERSKMHQRKSKNRCSPEKLPYFIDEKREEERLRRIKESYKLLKKKPRKRILSRSRSSSPQIDKHSSRHCRSRSRNKRKTLNSPKHNKSHAADHKHSYTLAYGQTHRPSSHSTHQHRRSRSLTPRRRSESSRIKSERTAKPATQIITVPVPVPDYAFHAYQAWSPLETWEPRSHYSQCIRPQRFPPYRLPLHRMPAIPMPRAPLPYGASYIPPPTQYCISPMGLPIARTYRYPSWKYST